MREYSTGTYSAPAYFLAKSLVELPMTLLQNVVQYALVYPLCNFRGNVLYMILTAWGLGASAASVACLLGCLVPNVTSVQELAPVVFVPQMLFSGFFIQTSKIPNFLRWSQWLCSMKYAMNLLILTEFNSGSPSCSGAAGEACKQITIDNDIVDADWWIYTLVLIALVVGFRVIACLVLAQKAKQFY